MNENETVQTQGDQNGITEVGEQMLEGSISELLESV